MYHMHLQGGGLCLVLLSSEAESFFKLADAAQEVHRQLKQCGVLQVCALCNAAVHGTLGEPLLRKAVGAEFRECTVCDAAVRVILVKSLLRKAVGAGFRKCAVCGPAVRVILVKSLLRKIVGGGFRKCTVCDAAV